MHTDQHRKYMITIQHPHDRGFSHDTIRDILHSMNITYYCMCDEIASTGTPHTHIFFWRRTAIRVRTIMSKFPDCHYDICLGTCKENRDYLMKTGKYERTGKAETRVSGSFEEWGELPDDAQENNPGSADVIAAIDEGKSTEAIIRELPKNIWRTNDINTLRETLISGKYLYCERDVHVIYIFGSTGVGKTRFIYDSHDITDIYRVTNYAHNGIRFDGYRGQRILVFEEFHSQIPIADMLNYLDRYPLALPARYTDHTACYTQVYITSNLPLKAQYPDQQYNNRAVWEAFLRRIDTVIQFMSDGTKIELLSKEMELI